MIITIAENGLSNAVESFESSTIPNVGDFLTVDSLEFEPIHAREFVVEGNELIEVILYAKRKTC